LHTIDWQTTSLVLRKIEGGDCAGGIKIESRSGRAVDNEIDFVVAWHNRLFMVECKTKNMKQQDVGNQELYRIDFPCKSSWVTILPPPC
jgi:hypothetical protein